LRTRATFLRDLAPDFPQYMGESSLLMRIATTESVSLCMPMKS